MAYYLVNNPLLQIAAFMLAGFVLLLTFGLLNRFIASIVEEKKQVFLVQWRRFQIAVWIVYSVLLYSLFLRYDMAMTLIITVIVVGLGWKFWKDIFAGILIKLENKFTVGDFVSTEFTKGVLESVKLSQSELINDAGEIVNVPNRYLRSEILTHHQTVTDASIYSVEVISAPGQTISELYEFAYNCPYISANKEITIEKQRDKVFNIRASIIDASFAEQADHYFENLAKNEKGLEH